MTNPASGLAKEERERDWLVRHANGCPACHAVRDRPCTFRSTDGKLVPEVMVHVARYDVAAALGLVPAILPSPGRFRDMDFQQIPHAEWTPIRGHESVAEIYQDTGTPQGLAIDVGRMWWADPLSMRQPCSILLRTPGTVYPRGWQPPFIPAYRTPQMWWVLTETREVA